MRTKIFGSGFESAKDRGRIPTQMEVIRDVMLSAAECAGQSSHAAVRANVGRVANCRPTPVG